MENPLRRGAVEPVPTLKSSRHEAFVRGVLEGKPGYQAYLDAGYGCTVPAARVAASVLLTKPNIQARISELQSKVTAKAVERAGVSRAWVLEKLKKNAEITLGEKKVMLTRAVRSRTKTGDGGFVDTVDTVEVEVSDRDGSAFNRSIELLGREADEAAMFVERREVGNPGDFDGRTDDDLIREFESLTGGAAAGRRYSGRTRTPRDPKTLQ